MDLIGRKEGRTERREERRGSKAALTKDKPLPWLTDERKWKWWKTTQLFNFEFDITKKYCCLPTSSSSSRGYSILFCFVVAFFSPKLIFLTKPNGRIYSPAAVFYCALTDSALFSNFQKRQSESCNNTFPTKMLQSCVFINRTTFQIIMTPRRPPFPTAKGLFSVSDNGIRIRRPLRFNKKKS